jgi:hypothetical protein
MDRMVTIICSTSRADRLVVRIMAIWLVLLVAVQAKQCLGGM